MQKAVSRYGVGSVARFTRSYVLTSKSVPLDGVSNTRAWLKSSDCNLDDLKRCVEGLKADKSAYPLAAEVMDGAVVYDRDSLVDSSSSSSLIDADTGKSLEREMMHALSEGPGIVIIKKAWKDAGIIDECTAVFNDIIAEEKAKGGEAGDHFGEPGANSRIWNAHEKLAVKNPDVFVRYYSNDILPIVGRAWLGPHYQVTAQVNVVHPGGKAQQAHRDYHLGFMSESQTEEFPAHVHALAAAMTLQGAVAHCDMPLESGPTEYLPFSHKYEHGYIAYHQEAFASYFKENYLQLPLRKGDAVFFNPALLHAAGENVSESIDRIGNLLQLSSAFGRSMETVDRERVCRAIYGPLLEHSGTDAWTEHHTANVVAAAAEGYAFPTNLDFDQPVDGIAPPSQARVLADSIATRAPSETFFSDLSGHSGRRKSH